MARRTAARLLVSAMLVAACSDSTTAPSSATGPTTTAAAPSTTAATEAPPASVAAWQQTVDDLQALQGAQQLPQRLQQPGARLDGSEFDVSEYFSVLRHIDVEPGFVLDYVYRFTPDRGFPVLYVRRADAPRYETDEEYEAGTGSPGVQGDQAFMEQVYVVDGTPDGFFEYVVLSLMGGQFYRFWHAAQDDATVVVTRDRLDEVLEPVAARMDEAELERARSSDPTPVLGGDGDAVTVEVHVFTAYGGLFRHRYTIERLFPQRILEIEIDQVAVCDCGVPF